MLNNDIIFIILICVVELIRPREKYRFFKAEFLEDISFSLIYIYIVPRLHNFFPETTSYLRSFSPIGVDGFSDWMMFPICLMAGDFLLFLIHFSMHRFELMWKTHTLHHTAIEVTWSSAFRVGYGEDVAMFLFVIIPMHIIRVDPWIMEGCFTVYGIHGYFAHSNVKFRMPKWLGFVGCPHFHQWHHEKKYSSLVAKTLEQFSLYGTKFLKHMCFRMNLLQISGFMAMKK